MKEIQLFTSAMDAKGRTQAARAFGIDLGTTNSSVTEASWVSGEKPVCRVLEIDQPLWPAGTMTSSLVPSVVAVLDNEGPMVGEGADRIVEAGRTTRCVVFDFGGGTCDVSVLEITADKKTKQILMGQIAVSRYHRLGGGDLDAAIVHEHLIPSLLKENGLGPLDLTWAEKKRGLEPQLLGTAEALKEALCYL